MSTLGKKVLFPVALLLAVSITGITGCGRKQEAASPENRIKVFVSIEPQAYFLQRIGGDLVDIHVLVGPGQSPATYEPTPKQMAELARSDIYFEIGVPFEQTLSGKIANLFRNLDVIKTQKNVPVRHLLRHSHEGFVKGSGVDPHIWLSPALAKIQAKNIRNGLRRYDPADAPIFDENLTSFLHDLDSVRTQIQQILAPYKGDTMYVFHPAYGYFAQAFGLVQAPVEAEGKEPSARELQQVITLMKSARNKVLFVQPQFSEKTARTIAAAIGGEVVVLDPLSRDYLNNLVVMANEIAEALPPKSIGTDTGMQRNSGE